MTDCGVACLLMVLKYYKGSVSLEFLRKLSNTTKKGTSAYDLIEAAKKLGFEAYGIRLKTIQEQSLFPVIAHVIIEQKYHHYIVIYRINLRKKRLLVADPARGIHTLSFAQFDQLWDQVLIMLYPVTTLPVMGDYSKLSSFFITLLPANIKSIIKIIGLSFLLGITTVITSFYFNFAIDSIQFQESQVYLVFLFLFFGIMFLFHNATDYHRNKLVQRWNEMLTITFMTTFIKRLVYLPYHYYHSRTTGDVIAKLNDVVLIQEFFSKAIVVFTYDVLFLIIAMSVLYCVNKTLFFLCAASFFLELTFTFFLNPIYQKSIAHLQKKKGYVANLLTELLAGYESIKNMHLEEVAIDSFFQQYTQLLNANYQYQSIYLVQQGMKKLWKDLTFCFLIALGGMYVALETITLGTLLSFQLLFHYFQTSIQNIFFLVSDYHKAKISFERICFLLEKESEKTYLECHLIGNLFFHQVTFQYQEKKILNQLSLIIPKGKKIMIRGASGSGKSTLLKILLGYYEVERGMITIDGVDLNDIDPVDLKQLITYLGNEELLLTDSIFQNIVFHRSVDATKLTEILRLCRIGPILKARNLGLHFLLEENGSNISGGERQRILLARALLNSFEILLIDEGLNRMDPSLERRILQDLFEKYRTKTIVVVSHRANNMDLFDQCYEMKQGILSSRSPGSYSCIL